MADVEQIEALRRLIDEPGQDPYTDLILSTRIDASPSLQVLAGTLWREKAARYAGMIDMKEGNSDRKLSQLHKQALTMADSFVVVDEDGDPVTATRRPSRTRRIERV